MKKLLLIILTGLMIIFLACEKDQIMDFTPDESNMEFITVIDPSFPNDIVEKIPVNPNNKRPSYNLDIAKSNPLPPSTLLPEECNETAHQGDIIWERKRARLYLPSNADIMFHFDVSGSMGGEIDNFEANAATIFSTIKGSIPGLRGGISYGCDENNWGNYVTHCPLTADQSEFVAYMNPMPPEGTGTFPWPVKGGAEQYGYQLMRLAMDDIPMPDDLIGWTPVGAQKIVVAFLDESVRAGDAYDDRPYYEKVDDAITQLVQHNIVLIVLYSGFSSADLAEWNTKAGQTGGCAFQTNSDGTIPDGQISDFILQKIAEVNAVIGDVKLEILPPAIPGDPDYSSWLANCMPASYSDVPSGTPKRFRIAFEVPLDATIGLHEFKVSLMGDGAEYDYQTVRINVVEESWPIDAKPGSCPNPFNPGSRGNVPIAVLGTDILNVYDITSVALVDPITEDEIYPVRGPQYEDVSTPYLGELVDRFDCTTAGPDTFMDAVYHFKTSEIAGLSHLAGLARGDTFILLMRINNVYGEDIMWLVKDL